MSRNKRNTIALAVVAGAAFAAGRIDFAPAQQAMAVAQDTQDVPVEMMEQMQAMMEAGAPGEHHKHLNTLVGNWEGEVKMWMAPGAPPMEAPATVTREWVLDGRFVKETVSSVTPDGTFEAIGYTGYNNVDGHYEMIWMENMSSAISWTTGTFNPDSGKLTTYGTYRNPATGKVMHAYGTLDMSSPDRHTYVGYAVAENGHRYKNFEGVFERVK